MGTAARIIGRLSVVGFILLRMPAGLVRSGRKRSRNSAMPQIVIFMAPPPGATPSCRRAAR